MIEHSIANRSKAGFLPEETTRRLIQMRRVFHREPEISGSEFETAEKIEEYLSQYSVASTMRVGNTGVIARFESDEAGPRILIRVDIDALPIAETNTFEHRSTRKGISHKCGHDGHATIGLGLAEAMSRNKLSRGAVHILFQPAEENGEGAMAVWNDLKFDGHSYDYTFALHNLPGFALAEVVVKDGPFTAQVQSIILALQGKTAHAAEPEHGKNPALAMAAILSFVDGLNRNEPSESDFFVGVAVHAVLGTPAYGISAGDGELHFTMRAWEPALLKEKTQQILNFAQARAAENGLKIEVSYTQKFEANINAEKGNDFIRKGAASLALKVREVDTPFKWGEDFGYFTQRIPGAMFGLGAGLECPALHNPDYDFPDELISTGVGLFYQIIAEVLAQ